MKINISSQYFIYFLFYLNLKTIYYKLHILKYNIYLDIYLKYLFENLSKNYLKYLFRNNYLEIFIWKILI